jgi:hypothetical protein
MWIGAALNDTAAPDRTRGLSAATARSTRTRQAGRWRSAKAAQPGDGADGRGRPARTLSTDGTIGRLGHVRAEQVIDTVEGADGADLRLAGTFALPGAGRGDRAAGAGPGGRHAAPRRVQRRREVRLSGSVTGVAAGGVTTVPSMRHLGTLIAAIVIAPLAWVLLAFGQDRSAAAFAAESVGGLHRGDFVRPLQYLAAAGLLLGLIATLRFSPLGALATGVAYTSSFALLLIAPNDVMNVFRHGLSVAGHHADPATPIRTGTTPLLGVLLLVAALSVGRWRRWPRSTDSSSGTAVWEDRPLGADGLGLTPANRGAAEPEFAARFVSSPEPALSRGSQASWATSSGGRAEGPPW